MCGGAFESAERHDLKKMSDIRGNEKSLNLKI